MAKQGALYLVGLGPGDPGLITVKGLALLREAEAIVGDTLTHAPLLQEAQPEAELYDIGSFRRGSKMPQAEINRLLIELAQQGKTVVRLWAGDPFVFGKAAEEISAARQAGIRVEVTPGVTSAIAGPAYAGVPVTHWDYAASFAVVAGHVFKEAPVQPNWIALAGVETLVILMPLGNLEEIVARLLAAGRPAETPALALQHASLPQQKQALATLGTLVEAAKTHQIEHPALVVVGEVVKLAPELAWFKVSAGYPLLGKRVLVTRPTHQAADFMAALRAMGAEPISFPTIEIRPVEDSRPLAEAIQELGEWVSRRVREPTRPQVDLFLSPPLPLPRPPYDWLVLTSANGVAAFWEQLRQGGLDGRCLAPLRIAAIGPATAEALWRRSIQPDLRPKVYTAEGILAAFDRLGSIAGQRFLLARADIARKTLTEGLRERGALVDEVAAYRTVPRAEGPLPPAADIVTFTSSSTVQGYVNCLAGRAPAEALRHSQVVCIGPITAATARELGLPISAVAAEYTIEGLLAALRELEA